MRQTLYCAACGLEDERERASVELRPCASCGSTVFTTMAPALGWSAYDKRLLNSLRISVDDAQHDTGD